MMTYNEHMKWAKMRALEYVEAGLLDQAVTSMLSDLSKHPETRPIGRSLSGLGLFALSQGPEHVRRFITGFVDGGEAPAHTGEGTAP